jgi:hypothetical protein
MSDLRQFSPSTGDSPRFIDEPVIHTQPVRDDVVIIDDGGLADMHVRQDIEEEGSGRNKLFAGLAVAVLVGIGGAYGVNQYLKTQPVVADNRLPSPSAPTRTAAMTPPPAPAPVAQDAKAPAAPDMGKAAPLTRQATITNAPTNAPKLMATPKPLTSTASNSAPATPAPVEVTPAPVQTQASNVPEPVSPTPPAAAFAGIPALNEQTAQPQVDQVQAPAAAAPVEQAPAQAAQAEPAAPASTPAEPAPPAAPAQ